MIYLIDKFQIFAAITSLEILKSFIFIVAVGIFWNGYYFTSKKARKSEHEQRPLLKAAGHLAIFMFFAGKV